MESSVGLHGIRTKNVDFMRMRRPLIRQHENKSQPPITCSRPRAITDCYSALDRQKYRLIYQIPNKTRVCFLEKIKEWRLSFASIRFSWCVFVLSKQTIKGSWDMESYSAAVILYHFSVTNRPLRGSCETGSKKTDITENEGLGKIGINDWSLPWVCRIFMLYTMSR